MTRPRSRAPEDGSPGSRCQTPGIGSRQALRFDRLAAGEQPLPSASRAASRARTRSAGGRSGRGPGRSRPSVRPWTRTSPTDGAAQATSRRPQRARRSPRARGRGDRATRDQLELFDVVGVVAAVASFRTLGGAREQPDLLVVADRARVRPVRAATSPMRRVRPFCRESSVDVLIMTLTSSLCDSPANRRFADRRRLSRRSGGLLTRRTVRGGRLCSPLHAGADLGIGHRGVPDDFVCIRPSPARGPASVRHEHSTGRRWRRPGPRR